MDAVAAKLAAGCRRGLKNRLRPPKGRCPSRLLMSLACIFVVGVPSAARAQSIESGTMPDVFNDPNTKGQETRFLEETGFLQSGVVRLGKKDGLLGPYLDTSYYGPFLYLRHLGGDGVGYKDDGFSTVGLFAPKKFLGGMLFTEGRLSVSDNGDMIGNAGGGYRIFCEHWNRLFGISGWYDLDDGHRRSFQQAAFNLETRGEYWDLLANLYIPIYEDDKKINTFFVSPTGVQSSGQPPGPPYSIFDEFESAMKGIDVEFGGPLPYVGIWGIRGYAGWYHYETNGRTDINGARGRITAEITDALSGQVLLTNDAEYGTSIVFGITWSIPGTGVNRGPTRMPPGLIRSRDTVMRAQSPDTFSESMQYRMFQPVQRNDRIVVVDQLIETLVN